MLAVCYADLFGSLREFGFWRLGYRSCVHYRKPRTDRDGSIFVLEMYMESRKGYIEGLAAIVQAEIQCSRYEKDWSTPHTIEPPVRSDNLNVHDVM